MPRKSQPEEEIVIDEPTTPVKKETVATRWFRNYAVNNKSEMITICELTARSVQDQFNLVVTSGNYELYAVVYHTTFMAILDFLKNKQSSYSTFSISVANSSQIGYVNNTDENNEKVGNFMPVIKHVGINANVPPEPTIEKDETTALASKYIKWLTINSKQTVDYYKDIQEKAFNQLDKEFGIRLRTSEAVIPMFCIFMDHVVNLIKLKYQEALGTGVSEVSMNVLGLYDIFYSFDEEANVEYIEYTPNVTIKLKLKSDIVSDTDDA